MREKVFRQISRELQISRKTVKKYIREHEEVLRSAESEEVGRTSNLSRAPIYKKTIPRTKIKLTREVEAAIDELLETENENINICQNKNSRFILFGGISKKNKTNLVAILNWHTFRVK